MEDPVSWDVVEVLFAELLFSVKQAINTVKSFQPRLMSIETALNSLKSQIEEMKTFNDQLDRPDMELKPIQELMKEGLALINKCQKMNDEELWDKQTYSTKLLDLHNGILSFCQIDLVGQVVKDVETNVDVELADTVDRLSVLQENDKNIEVKTYNVPQGPDFVVGLDIPFKNIKEELLNGTEPVIIISGAVGYGKTSLAKTLCHDQLVKGKYKDYIIFIVVSESPNLMTIIQQIINQFGGKVPDPETHSEDDGVQDLRQLLAERGKQNPILLILDDIGSGSESILEKFVYKDIPDYKVLVTSRSEFPDFGHSHQLKGLQHEDAVKLLRHSATPLSGSYVLPNEEIIDQLVERCKGSPLALTVVGMSLCGRPRATWLEKLNNSSSSYSSLFDSLMNVDAGSEELARLKQFFLDLSSFPEDHMIPNETLIDMRSELYDINTREEVIAATNKHIDQLCACNLVDLIIRKDNHDGCYYKYFRQHALLQELALSQNSCGPIEERERLNLNIPNNELPNWITEQKQPLRARLLSICTDETFSSSWPDLELPEVEVLILNLRTIKDCTLPNFIRTMVNLRSLIVTNNNDYTSFPVELRNFEILGCLPNLKKIRLVHIKTPSSRSMSTACLNNLSEVLVFQGISLEGSDTNGFVRFHETHLASIIAIDGEEANFITGKEAKKLERYETDDFLVGLNVSFEKMKKKLLNGAQTVLIVSAPGGFGKTTLVKKLCDDKDVKDKYKENIIFVALSQSPNLIATIQQIFHSKKKTVPVVHTEDDAVRHFHKMIEELGKVNPVLLVLDDMWLESESILQKLILERIPNYKILVTSRDEFPTYGPSHCLNGLNAKDSVELLCHVAGQGGSTDLMKIIKQVVKHCGGSPLALTLVGKSLYGKSDVIWKKRLNELSHVIQLNNTDKLSSPTLGCILNSLKCLDGSSGFDSIKQYFLDLSLFPASHKIPVPALIDIWSELHDGDGVDTIANLTELNARGLADLIVTRKYSSKEDDYYNEMYVMQHYLLREAAILQNNLRPRELRERLNLDSRTRAFLDWSKKQTKPLDARLLSIFTDKTYPACWLDLDLPKVEVLVLNFWATVEYTLPNFIEKLTQIKTWIVINHGLFPVEVTNFALLGYMFIKLKRIRLECIKIPFLSMHSRHFQHLEKVTISNCIISEEIIKSDARICDALPKLKEIDISGCRDLKSLPVGICDVVALRKISITHCENLSQLPDNIGNLSNLKVLRVSSCEHFLGLPISIIKLTNLSFLDISNCVSIASLPYYLGSFSKLKELHINGCLSLCGLPESIHRLKNLKHLYCDKRHTEFNTRFREPYPKIEVVEEDSH